MKFNRGGNSVAIEFSETHVFPLDRSNDIIFNYILVCGKLWKDRLWSVGVCEAWTVMLR